MVWAWAATALVLELNCNSSLESVTWKTKESLCVTQSQKKKIPTKTSLILSYLTSLCNFCKVDTISFSSDVLDSFWGVWEERECSVISTALVLQSHRFQVGYDVNMQFTGCPISLCINLILHSNIMRTKEISTKAKRPQDHTDVTENLKSNRL